MTGFIWGMLVVLTRLQRHLSSQKMFQRSYKRGYVRQFCFQQVCFILEATHWIMKEMRRTTDGVDVVALRKSLKAGVFVADTE